MRDNVMVDLETVGSVPGCAILSIGAVAFDRSGVDEFPYSILIDRRSCKAAGLHEDAETLAWWAKQASHVAQVLDLALDPEVAIELRDALSDFNEWLGQHGADVKLWGNGADFDNAVLAAAYRAVGLKPAWKFWNGRCYRTLKNLHPSIKLNRIGSLHNAADDALSQAEHAVRLLNA